MSNEWMDGYQWGYLHGLEAGGDIRDAEWNARFSRAVQIVHAAARWPEQSREARRARMEKAEREINARLDAIRAQTPSDNQPGKEQWPEPSFLHGAVAESTTTQRGAQQ